MRQKKESVLCFASNDEGLPKVLRDYRDRYRTISQVLDQNSEILDVVHQDLKKLSQGDRRGRKGDFTSENILRALIVQDMEGLPFWEAFAIYDRHRAPGGVIAIHISNRTQVRDEGVKKLQQALKNCRIEH
jgi:hypothetical protein